MALVTGTKASETLTGTSVNDTVKGVAGNDTLNGLAGNDILLGGAGNDTLIGGAGKDTLTGGTGGDTFKYLARSDSAPGTNADLIKDFNAGLGDKVDLTALGNATLQSTYTAGFSGLQAVFAYNASNNQTTLSYYEGSSTAVFQIKFVGNVAYSTAFLGIVEASPLTPVEIRGTEDSDYIHAFDYSSNYNRNEIIYGLGGDDQIDGWGGNNVLIGGGGNDYLEADATGTNTAVFDDVSTNYALAPDGGGWISITNTITFEVDRLYNIDTLKFSDGEKSIKNYGPFEITGTFFSDTLHGTYANDNITAGADNDHIISSGGDDVIDGGEGSDIATLDLSSASSGFTFVFSPNMTVATPYGVTTLINIEHVDIDGSAYDDYITGGSGNDYLEGRAGNDTINGGEGYDYLDGGAGDDTLVGASGGGDSFEGGDGTDKVILSGASTDYSFVPYWSEGGFANQSLMVTDNRAQSPDGTNYIYSGIEFVQFSDKTVALSSMTFLVDGTSGNDTLHGSPYNDILNGFAGNDYLYGEYGNDSVNGEAGDDFLDGGWGNDVLNGGEGNDRAFLEFLDTSGGANYTFVPGATVTTTLGQKTLTDIESVLISGSQYNDVFTGGASHDNVLGRGGNDTLSGLGGDDYLNGGGGDDTVNGGAGNDQIYGELYDDAPGNDTLIGGLGDDLIDGLGGNDTIRGGGGSDNLRGGAGADKFVYGAVSDSPKVGYDTIDDFESGVDKIDLSLIDANGAATGNGAFNFWNGAGAMNTTIGNVQIVGSNVYLYLPGDTVADGMIAFNTDYGSVPNSGDFIF